MLWSALPFPAVRPSAVLPLSCPVVKNVPLRYACLAAHGTLSCRSRLFLCFCWFSITLSIIHTPFLTVLKQSDGLCQSHGNCTPAWFSCSRTHCVRRCERSGCGCTGVSLSDGTGHGWKRGQAFSMDTGIVRSLTRQEIRSWRTCSNGSLSV